LSCDATEAAHGAGFRLRSEGGGSGVTSTDDDDPMRGGAARVRPTWGSDWLEDETNMGNKSTAPRLGARLPPLPPPRDSANEADDGGALRTGDLIDGRYQIEGLLGEGGAGVVYRALQIKLHRRVAVKLLQAETDAELRTRFEREAVTLAALSHPNIVSVQDYGHTRSKPFLVMELLQGRTLRDVIDAEGALSVPRALSLTREVLLALAYAHDLGIVHRDLKPANLLVQTLPHHEHVKVLDFGFVKLLPGSYLDRGVQLSRVGFTFGTPAYMSPEHATGGDIDGRSDLYSLGILLFEMLTATKPFEGELPELIRAHLSAKRPRLADIRPELAGRDDLQALVERAMATERAGRFDDAGAFLRALDGIVLSPKERAAQTATPHVEPVGVGAELRLLGQSCRRFFTESTRIMLRRARPALSHTRANFGQGTAHLGNQVRRTFLALHLRMLALFARMQPGLLQAKGAIRTLARPWLQRLTKRSQLEASSESATLTYEEVQTRAKPEMASPGVARTMVLEDPTHLDLPAVRPPSPETAGGPRMAGE